MLILITALALSLPAPPLPTTAADVPDIRERTIAEMGKDLDAGRITSVELVDLYLERIERLDRGQTGLHSILIVNPRARIMAKAMDSERALGHTRGPLHGIPIVVKDNIEVMGPMPTTAGSLALQHNITNRDAAVIERLRRAGAVVLGKTNLSEWANIRSSTSSSGWSAVGGLTVNPYDHTRSACGSSSGTGAAVSANLAAAGLGTETDGSVTCPAAMNGLVGLKPTVGLVSRRHIVPISHSQDTAGPMARTVADTAALLTAMAGHDPADPATVDADSYAIDFVASLDDTPLRGARLGVMWFHTDWCDDDQLTQFEATLEQLRTLGVELVDIRTFPGMDEIHRQELDVLLHELKADLNVYLKTTADSVQTRSLADVIEFNQANANVEMPHFKQELFVQAQSLPDLTDTTYLIAMQDAKRRAGIDGIDRLIAQHDVIALIAPTTGPAFKITLQGGDQFGGAATTLPAVAGYPHLTVPAGMVGGLPVGLSFIGPEWSEARLLGLGHRFERATHGRTPPGD